MQLPAHKVIYYISFLLIATACTSSGSLHYPGNSRTSGDGASYLPDRPIPREIVPPMGYTNAVTRGSRTDKGSPGEAYWQQFSEYDIDVTLHPEEKKITATAQIVYHNHSPDTLRQLQMELVQNLHAEGVVRNRPAEVTGGITFDSVIVNGVTLSDEPGQGFHYRVQGTRMVLRNPEPLAPGAKAELEISYSFVIPQRGAGGRMGYSDDNLFYLGYWYPHMVVYDDVLGWHPDPYLGTAEFYHGFADYELTIRAPEGWIVMATGNLVNASEVLSAEVLSRWDAARQSDEPVRVFTAGEDSIPTVRGDGNLAWRFSAQNVRDVAFSAALASNWDSARTPVGDLTGDGKTDFTVLNTFWRDDAPLWSEVTAYQQHAITFLSEMTGYAYPWPHMTAIEGAGIIGGGMEYPMMTIMGDYNQRGAAALYSVTAHELAHMWVPLIVSTDERRYTWLDEGNTVFSTAEAMMDFNPDHRPHPVRQAQSAYTRMARQGNEGPMMRKSDYHYSTAQFLIASYRKPSVVLSALRKVLGEDIFWKSYQTFIEEWAFKQAYPWDFFRTFERVSGEDLSWFWHSWYYETWVLDQSVDLVEEVDEGTRIVIRDNGDVPMPVFITVTYDGDSNAEHIIPVDPWLNGKRSVEIVVPEKNVRRVEIDRDRDLPDINRQNAVWERRRNF